MLKFAQNNNFLSEFRFYFANNCQKFIKKTEKMIEKSELIEPSEGKSAQRSISRQPSSKIDYNKVAQAETHFLDSLVKIMTNTQNSQLFQQVNNGRDEELR